MKKYSKKETHKPSAEHIKRYKPGVATPGVTQFDRNRKPKKHHLDPLLSGFLGGLFVLAVVTVFTMKLHGVI